jgi:hypothetical protein
MSEPRWLQIPPDSYANAVSGCFHAGAVQACLHERFSGRILDLLYLSA